MCDGCSAFYVVTEVDFPNHKYLFSKNRTVNVTNNFKFGIFRLR